VDSSGAGKTNADDTNRAIVDLDVLKGPPYI
jgi:hypothetical protein